MYLSLLFPFEFQFTNVFCIFQFRITSWLLTQVYICHWRQISAADLCTIHSLCFLQAFICGIVSLGIGLLATQTGGSLSQVGLYIFITLSCGWNHSKHLFLGKCRFPYIGWCTFWGAILMPLDDNLRHWGPNPENQLEGNPHLNMTVFPIQITKSEHSGSSFTNPKQNSVPTRAF